MRIRATLIAVCLALSTSVYAQEQATDLVATLPMVDKKDQDITELKKQAAEQKKQIDALVGAVTQIPKPVPPSAEQQKQTLREQYARVFKLSREQAEAGCKDAGGKKISAVSIDGSGKPGVTCEF